MIVGLEALLCLAKRYEFDMDKDRKPLHDIVNMSFPLLGILVNKLIQVQPNQTVLEIILLICSIFFRSN